MRSLLLTTLLVGAAVSGPSWAQTPLESLLPSESAASSQEGGAAPMPATPAEPAPSAAGQPATSGGATPIDNLLGTTGNTALDQQNVDPNQALLDALIVSRRVGPDFRASPETITLSMEEGASDSERIRLTNLGDTAGNVRGVNALGAFDGLLVTNTCPPTLEPAAFCDIAVSYTGEDPVDLRTVIAIGLEGGPLASIEIPLSVTVESTIPVGPAEPVTPVPPPIDPNAVDPSQQGGLGADTGPRPPTPEEIARAYIGATAGGNVVGPMAVVTMPDSLRPVEEVGFLGGSEGQLSVETISQDPRYPDTIASTEATLPVDRDRILTTDRVIKAVLETPFSNVMCGKVVALVESDVYSATSAVPLIQAGSRVVGRCGELVKERAGIVWERILTVDGRSISLAGENSMTRDASGLGGALGRVYRTPFDRYILPLFGTGVDVAAGVVEANYGEDEQQTVTETGQVAQNTSARNRGIQTATESIRGTTQEIITDLQDVREVLVVPAGSRIDIQLFEDIYFKDEREIVRIADTVYDVPSAPMAQAPVTSPDAIELVPYRAGLEGPVVMVNGRRFIVRESQGAAMAPAAPNGAPPGAAATPAQPTAPGQGGRPTATSPVAPSTQQTLDDLNSPPGAAG